MMSRKKGTIQSWFDEKGYGFIKPDSGEGQFFVHISNFETRGLRPAVNQSITYLPSLDTQGRKRAVDVRQDNSSAISENRDFHFPSTKSRRNILPLTGSLLFISGFTSFVFFLVKAGKLPLLIPILYITLSVISLFVYAFDKFKARRGYWRISEAELHLIDLAGGWPGGLIAQQLFNHKRSKSSFTSFYWLMVLINCGVLAWLFIGDKKAEAWQFSEQLLTLIKGVAG